MIIAAELDRTLDPRFAALLEPLIEAAPADYFWGVGRTGTGKNRLGVLLMELRAALRADG